MHRTFRSQRLRVLVATLLATLTVASVHASEDAPRIKPKNDAPASEFSLPRVPLSDYSAGLETETVSGRSHSPTSPNGLRSLDAHKREPIAPFLGLSLKRPLN